MMIKIAITDDHPAVREGIRAMLQSIDGFEVTAMHASGNACLLGLQKELPDVLLLDISLPDINGSELAPRILAQYPGLAIIILTSIDSVYLIKSLLHSGVKSYLLKTSGQELLEQAITTALNGKVFLPPDIQSILAASTLDPGTSIHNRHISLTDKEIEILQLIAAEHTSQEIAEKMFLSVRTIDKYRLGLMEKLDVKNLAGLVRKAIMMGVVK